MKAHTICCLALGLVFLGGPVMAQDDTTLGETEDGATDDGSAEEAPTGTWRPSAGPLFGSSTTQQQSTSSDDLTGRDPGHNTDDTVADGRTQLLVFDIQYEDGITFDDTYLRRFASGYRAILDEGPTYRPMSARERRLALRDSGVLVVGEIDAERADEIAQAIGVTHYLLPLVEIENSRTYRITLVLGEAGAGEAGQMVASRTSSRTIDTVEARLLSATREALGIE